MLEDIGKYKPEELKLRNGDQVVDYFLNGLDRSNGSYYTVVYKTDNDDYYIIKTSKAGKYGFREESYYDVILKTPPEPILNLEDYLDKPEELQTKGGCGVICIGKIPDAKNEYAYAAVFGSKGHISTETYNSQGICFDDKPFGYKQLILKPKVKEFDLADYLGRHELLETVAGYQVLALVKGYSESYEAFIHKDDDERILTITYNSNGKAKYTSESAWTLKLKEQN